MDDSPRKRQYKWFSSFLNPCYSISKRIDVTNVVLHARENKQSFFINFLYVIIEALHSVDEMRMRISGDDVVLFDILNPHYTVMTDEGYFENCKHEMTHNFEEFYRRAEAAIIPTKHNLQTLESFDDLSIVDSFYISCIPWIDAESFTQPIPDMSKENASIPRVIWGKYSLTAGRYEMTVSICVNHALVDGKPLSDTYLHLEKIIENINPLVPTINGWGML